MTNPRFNAALSAAFHFVFDEVSDRFERSQDHFAAMNSFFEYVVNGTKVDIAEWQRWPRMLNVMREVAAFFKHNDLLAVALDGLSTVQEERLDRLIDVVTRNDGKVSVLR